MKRVLVTGATGYIGRQVVPQLVARGWDVHAVSSREATGNRSDVIWHRADLLDPRQASEAVRRAAASHLLHLAWYAVPGRYPTAIENFAWVRGSIDLLRAFKEYGGTRVVTAGSCFEYDWRFGYCSEARTPCTPNTVYGVCKHALQTLTSAFADSVGVTSAWGRIFFLYGRDEHPDRLVASVVRSLLAGEPARCSHGNQVRDYLFAEDVANAFVALLESDITGPINVASGQAITLRELVLRIGELLGRSELIRFGAVPAGSSDAPLVVADVSRLRETLGWRPCNDLETGLTRTIEWWRERLSDAVERHS